MTKVQLIEGQAYYGHGEALCFTCRSFGKELGNKHKGEYDNSTLVQSEVDWLLELAKDHERTKPNHIVRVAIFKRSSESGYSEDYR